ncbi:uncharacterized protein LOC129914407 [Episyrphus balteatus]|uniref:uncharacterized protein LOC129914407 n=1 Tax=Episyrphus balteatus TaxID=286459 RepID=UPI002486784D|nr:uncharacterized protein LOC129914407 [Episyrphus balteatus]XP_055849625.1 uncharacterized protein LOC129914407 [Episyrphus balteatus]XP_055849626.1 uncharacterized protein LOC129914407 [Episyrphus balteatus]
MENEKPRSTPGSQRSSFTKDKPSTTPKPDPEPSEAMQRLMGFEDRKSTFYKTLEEALVLDYNKIKEDVENDRIPAHLPKYPLKEGENPTVEEKTNYYFNILKNECHEYIEPLHEDIGLSITAALETSNAFNQLNKMHDLLDNICDMLDQNFKMQLYMHELKDLTDNIDKKDQSENDDLELSEPESELEANISLLSSILESAKSMSTKRTTSNQRARERSKSVFVPGANQPTEKDPKPPPVRRQSAFTEGKSKVSKWTKVKAAFKWEKANVPALNECKSSDSGIGLLPINHEVARYLRVPSVPCGGSSADSILSSSSGHLLSETGTPGTISSASSVDDIERAIQTTRRDSSKSDSKCEFRVTVESDNHRSHSIDGELGSLYNRQEIKDSSPFQIKHQRNISESSDHKNSPTTSQSSLDRLVDVVKKPAKSSSLKGMRKSKIVPDFEALPEDVIVDITSRPKREKTLPSPLNLNLRHDLSESDCADYSQSPSGTAKSPWEKTKSRKFQSPGNSSVPSSPSRHSEFFPEFESEDLSSGDFSEPTTPHNKLFSSNSMNMQQEEINQRYIILRERLKMEFDTKRQEWDKIRNMYSNNPKTSAYYTIGKDDPPQQQQQQQQAKLVSTKALEENLTPDFKKKLHKWRVKKQISLHGNACKEAQISPTKDSECKKIDWNLWRTGQIKLEGQGLSPLPDQKDLPEDFQKKLEQWNKIKSSGPTHSGHDFARRSTKGEVPKKAHDDDKQKSDKEKPKTNERDKLERLSKLKAIVADPRAKEIEVKTTAGVMKFEGISRKFTRKLYEWEKARGIGPESSTFALLHPGYCPIDVGKIPKECKKNENSPTLSRSLSLDSVAPCAPLPTISHQTSSLSLNDVNDLNEAESTDAELRADCDLKQTGDYEPEAVMVEVEDDYVETACPLVAMLPMVEHQTPVYKYAEVTCSDFCKSRSVQSFESHHSSEGDKIKTLNYINDLWLQLESRNEFSDENLKYFQTVFATMRGSFSDFESNLNSSGAKRSFIKAKELVEDLYKINNLLLQDEACCQELIDERQMIFRNKLDDLHTTLNEVRQFIETERNNPQSIPDINVTYDDGIEDDRFSVSSTLANTAMALAAAAFSTTIDASDDIASPIPETPDLEAVRKVPNRNGSTKKKLRLRKMGSRQNSKTESDSTDGEGGSVIETPRRVKRKPSSRLKQQKSFDEDRKSAEENKAQDDSNAGEDIVYVLKVKPGQPIEQQEICQDKSSKLLISPTESCVQLIHNPQPEVISTTTSKSNVFVKTKRKVFTTVEDPGSADKLTAVATELTENVQKPEVTPIVTQLPSNASLENYSVKPSISPGIQNMITKLSESMTLEKIVSSSNRRRSDAFQSQHGHIYKSLSASSIFTDLPDDVQIKPETNLTAKSLSFSNLKKGWEFYQTTNQASHPLKTRMPLANDSFRLLKKINPTRNSRGSQSPSQVTERREHLFRKNRSGSPVVRLSAKGKRLESKLAKCVTTSEVPGYPLSPDKSDNTIPRITRKLENKSLTPTGKSSSFFQETVPAPSASEPSTPMIEIVEKPRTPLSERAIRLQKAKEEFLKSGALPKTVTMRREEVVDGQRTREKTENRRSHQSMCSDVSASGLDEMIFLKSVSVGALPADSDCSNQGDGYDSLPRSVSRSAKLTSKLGFATLASKLRKVKLRRGSKDNTTQPPPIKENTLSILCRQSLFVDLNPVTQQNLMKSQSSQAAIGGMRAKLESPNAESDNLNKSKSEHFFPHRQKESCV